MRKGNVSGLQAFINNRRNPIGKAFHYWTRRWRSGLMRLMERILAGANVSDRLGGDLSQIAHLEEVSNQIQETKVVSKSEFSHPIEVDGIPTIQASLPRKIGILNDCSVDLISGLIRLDSGFILDGVLPHWQQLLYQGGLTHEYRKTRNPKRYFSGTYLVVPTAKYFYHFIVESLPNISFALENYPGCKVLINSRSPKWQFEILEQLGIDFTVTVASAAKAQKLVFVTAPRLLTSNDLLRIKSLGKSFPTATLGLKLYIARGDKDRSNSKLESELKSLLLGKGFQIIYPDDLSFSEQKNLFENAKSIVSFHGGALTNIVWCGPGTKILEIFNHAFRTYDYAKICAESDLKYFSVNLHAATDFESLEDRKIQIIPDEFLADYE